MKKLSANSYIASIRAARRCNGWKATDWCFHKGNVMSLPLKWVSKPYTAQSMGLCWKCPLYDATNECCKDHLFFFGGKCLSSDRLMEIDKMIREMEE